jgi:4'-phosphopantetheinyl transferase
LPTVLVLSAATAGADVAALSARLDAAERARAAGLRDGGAALGFVAARALLRHALRVEFGVGAPRFETGTFGKPRLAGPGPRFSVAHAKGLVACAFSGDLEVGVDAEADEPVRERDGIVNELFAPPEAAALRAADPERRDEMFLRVWTLKEAVAKASGLGPALETRGFAVSLDPPGLGQSGPELRPLRQWRLWRWSAGGHVLALAARGEEASEAAMVERVVDLSSL